jgi:hypothetical protein
MEVANHIASLHAGPVQRTERRHLTASDFSERLFHMMQGYLVLATERCVINIMFADELDAIQEVLGCTAIRHGTTLHTEDQLLITGDELDHTATDRFWVAGVPFPFAGNAALVGIDPDTGEIADRPVMGIDEFQRLVMFTGSPDSRCFGSAPHVASGDDRGARCSCVRVNVCAMPDQMGIIRSCRSFPAR